MRLNGLSLWALLCLGSGCNRAALPAGNPPDALDSACGFAPTADPTRGVLAFAVDHDLRFTFADGSTRTVFTFANELPSPNTSFLGRVDDVRGGRVLADGGTYYAPPGEPAKFATELVLLDTAGNVLWHQEADGFGTPYLGADGTLAVWTLDEATLIVNTDGSTRTVAGEWSPIAPARDGSLLVQAPPPAGDGMLGWLRPGHSSVEMLAIQPSGYEEWVGDRVAYVGQKDGQDVLVLATPDESQVVELPPGDGQGIAIAGVAGDWMEVQRNGATTATIYRLNVQSGAVDLVQDQVPSGMRRFDAGDVGSPQLGDDGSLLQGFRNDFMGSLYRSTDAGASWAPLGFSVAKVQGLSVGSAAGGTFVVDGVQAVYAPSTPWAAPPTGFSPDLSGQFVEIARPGEGVRYQLPSLAGFRSIALGSAGRCAAYWPSSSDGLSARLEVLDVPGGARKTIVDGVDARAIEPPLWLER
jgi:hypothetical protein